MRAIEDSCRSVRSAPGYSPANTSLTVSKLRWFRRLLAVTLATGWFSTVYADGPPRRSIIEGYTDQQSYQPGDTVQFHVSSEFKDYMITVRRLGAKSRTMLTRQISDGRYFQVPERAWETGPGWPVAFTIKIAEDWSSGYYEVFTAANEPDQDGKLQEGQTMFFVVRSGVEQKPAPILLQLTANTWSAYSGWGGKSLYSNSSSDGLQGSKVSFRRPLQSDIYAWEYDFIVWADKNGYRLDYAVNADLEFHPEIVRRYPLVLSVGHDEYWSSGMRNNLEGYIAAGGNVAFFSGNSVTWQIRFEDKGDSFVTWKSRYRQDPQYREDGPNDLLTTLWSHHLVNRPENSMTGVGMAYGGMHLMHGQYMDGSGAFVVARPEHWVFAGTGLEADSEFGGTDTVVGYETDGCDYRIEDGKPVPTHSDGTPESFEILAMAPASWPASYWAWYERWDADREGNACMGVYQNPGGGMVFTAATTDWAHGLRGSDPVVEQITRNVLDRLSRQD